MSRVSERDFVASPTDVRPIRSILLHARACLESGQSVTEVSPRLASRVAPSLAMSTDAAAERGSQPAQRDELAHSHTVPICGGVSHPTNVSRYTSPLVTRNLVGYLRGSSGHFSRHGLVQL